MSMAEGSNPIKLDPELQTMLKTLGKVNKYYKFQQWKSKFLDRLETFIPQAGMNPATKTCNDFNKLMEKFVAKSAKVSGLVDSGALSNDKKSVKGTMSLNEMGNVIQDVIQDLKDLIPGVRAEEKKKGFNKFHLGAVLIRQGFPQFIQMKAMEDAVTGFEESCGGQSDRLLLDWYRQYILQVKRFCDVMADLGLYEVMMKCLEFAEEPDDESIDPDPINLTVKTLHTNKTIQLSDVDVRWNFGYIKDVVSPACEVTVEKMIMKYKDSECKDNEQTLEERGIPNNAVLTVEPIKVQITVRCHDGKEVKLMIDPETKTIGDIKADLVPTSKIPVDNQRLSRNGVAFTDDSNTAAFDGIEEGAVLDMEPNSITVNVELPDGRKMEVEVEPNDTAQRLKEKIEEKTGMIVPRQVLSHNNSEFPNDMTMTEKGVMNGDDIKVDIHKVPVTVRYFDGREAEIMVDPHDTLKKIKEDVADDSGIPANNQNLYKDGGLLDGDNKNAIDHGIQEGDVLDMEPKGMTVNIEMPDGSTFPVEISPRDKTEDIKKKIENKTGVIVPRQVLSSEGNVLPDGKTAKDNGLKDGSDIKVDIKKVPVKVRYYDGREADVMVDPYDTLRKIKEDVEDDAGIPAGNQNLFKGGKLLEGDNKKAIDHGIKEGDVLDLEPKGMTVNVQMPDGSTFPVDITPQDKTEDIKKKIEKKTGVIVPRQVLSSEGKDLKDGKTAKDQGLHDGSDIKVDIFKVPVTVRFFDGREAEVMVDPHDSLLKIKEDVQDDAGIPASNQNLFKDGTLLEGDKKHAIDHGIKAGDVLDLEPKGMTVNIEMPDGSTFPVEITPSDKTEDIKKKIEKKTGVIVPRQVLSSDGKNLKDGKTVKDLGLRDGADIKVDINKVPVTVRYYDGREAQVMVDPHDTLLKIKEDCEDDSGIPAGNQNLFKDGALLDGDGKKAIDHGIKEGDVLELEPKGMTVNIEMPDGSTFPVEITPRDKTEDIKKKIEDKTGVAVPRQVLSSAGKVLKDGKTAKDNGLKDGSDIKVGLFTVPVTVVTADKKTFEIDVEPTETLFEIKKKCEGDSGVPADNQNLSMAGNVLNGDSKTANDHGIGAGSELYLEPKKLAINIEMPDGSKFEMDIKPNDTADDIKQKIEDETGMKVPTQVLKSKGKELPNGKGALDMGLRDGSPVKVEIFKVPVDVNTIDGEKVRVLVDPSRPLSDIKKNLEGKTGVPADNQKLFMDGKELNDDNKTAGDYGIKAGTELDMEPKKMRVTVDLPDGTSIEIDVRPNDTADDIKKHVENACGLEVPRQVLSKAGRELPEGQTAKAMGVREGDKLKVDINSFPIIVKTQDGKDIKIDVEPSHTVDNIKEAIAPLCNIMPKKQRLTFNEDELKNGRQTVGACGIVRNSVLYVEANMDPIIFVDIKCHTLFGMDREDAVESGMLTPVEGNKLNFAEATEGPAAKEKTKTCLLGAKSLGVAPQVVVEGTEVEDLGVQEAEAVKSKFGVTLKKREKNKKGEEMFYIDPKTGAFGELSRQKALDMKFINLKGKELAETEQDTQQYDKYVSDIRGVFDIRVAK